MSHESLLLKEENNRRPRHVQVNPHFLCRSLLGHESPVPSRATISPRFEDQRQKRGAFDGQDDISTELWGWFIFLSPIAVEKYLGVAEWGTRTTPRRGSNVSLFTSRRCRFQTKSNRTWLVTWLGQQCLCTVWATRPGGGTSFSPLLSTYRGEEKFTSSVARSPIQHCKRHAVASALCNPCQLIGQSLEGPGLLRSALEKVHDMP